jgi:hypothetical protein
MFAGVAWASVCNGTCGAAPTKGSSLLQSSRKTLKRTVPSPKPEPQLPLQGQLLAEDNGSWTHVSSPVSVTTFVDQVFSAAERGSRTSHDAELSFAITFVGLLLLFGTMAACCLSSGNEGEIVQRPQPSPYDEVRLRGRTIDSLVLHISEQATKETLESRQAPPTAGEASPMSRQSSFSGPFKLVDAMQRSNALADGLPLCAEIVVPEGNECILSVPIVDLSASPKPLAIKDISGTTVLTMALATETHTRNLSLSSVSVGVLAKAHHDLAARPLVIRIADRTDNAFGVLEPFGTGVGEATYMFTSTTGNQITITTDAIQSSMSMRTCGKNGRLLAMVEETNSVCSRTLVVGSGVDVGLVLLCMYGIGLLTKSAAPVRSA